MRSPEFENSKLSWKDRLEPAKKPVLAALIIAASAFGAHMASDAYASQATKDTSKAAEIERTIGDPNKVGVQFAHPNEVVRFDSLKRDAADSADRAKNLNTLLQLAIIADIGLVIFAAYEVTEGPKPEAEPPLTTSEAQV